MVASAKHSVAFASQASGPDAGAGAAHDKAGSDSDDEFVAAPIRRSLLVPAERDLANIAEMFDVGVDEAFSGLPFAGKC